PSRNGVKCLEGIVDLALFNQKANEVFILDWKKNRIATDKIDVLKEIYRPQMAAYWQAIRSLTNALVSAAIYSTPTGEFLVYDRDELPGEEERGALYGKPGAPRRSALAFAADELLHAAIRFVVGHLNRGMFGE